MGSLSNLYISQSYQSLLHFGTDSGSTATLTEIEDGLGVGLGVYLNNSGSASFDGDITIGGDLVISGAIDIEGAIVIRDNVYVTGSIYSSADISSSRVLAGEITASNVFVVGTLTAYEVHTIIESSSIVFSTGSNILGDSTADTQTLNGKVIVSGSEEITGSLFVTNDISSSTISGIGNVTLYSQSVDARLDYLEGPFSTSVDARLDIVEATASLYVPFSQSVDARLDIVEATASLYVPFSTSVDSRLDYLEGPFSSSVSQQLVTLQLFTASVGLVTTQSFQNYTASTNQRLDSIENATSSLQNFSSSSNIRFTNLESTTASLNASISNLNISTASLNSFSASSNIRFTNLESTTASLNASISNLNGATASLQNCTASLNSKTGSYATTGSNTFVGQNTFNKSVNGSVNSLSIAANTASMDCSLGNFFTLTLDSAATTRLVANNIQSGQTITLKILQPTITGSLTYPSYIKFANALAYSASAVSGAVDIITFVTYDTTNLYAASTKNLI